MHQQGAGFDQLAQLGGHALQLQPVGLDLGEVQDVIEDAQQRHAGLVHRVKHAVLLRAEISLLQHVEHADHPVHGGADFVAHVRQKLRLGAVGGVGQGAGLGELAGALLHQALQLMAVQVQLHVQAFGLGDVLVNAQHAKSFALMVFQRDFGGAQPDRLAVRGGLGLVIKQPGYAAGHHPLVVASVQVSLLGPTHLVVVLADQLLRALFACITRKSRVAAHVIEVEVFPEHAHRNGVNHRHQQLVRSLQRGLGRFAFGDFLHCAQRHQGFALCVKQRVAAFLHPLDLAVGHQQPVFDLVGRLRGQ